MTDVRGEEAAERARVALARGAQLAARLAELRDKSPANPAAVEQATRSAHEALGHAERALWHAAAAHHRAAELHRRLADLLDQVGRPDGAAEHRRLADRDDEAGRADTDALREHVARAEEP
jgi:hypothetical protein